MQWKYSQWNDVLYVQNVTHGTTLGERCVAIHFDQSASNDSIHLFDLSKPDWYAAQVPTQATPAEVFGKTIVTTTSAPQCWTSIPVPPTTFKGWTKQLPPAEHRLLYFVTYFKSNAEMTIRQHMLNPKCTLYVGTDGGRKEAEGSFSWLICSSDREKLARNAGPVDGWHKCQSSFRSEITALSSALLFLDELATYLNIKVSCHIQLFVDSTSAISAIDAIRDCIPTRHYPDHADIISTLQDVKKVIFQSSCQHVKSHQDNKKDFSDLPFSAQVNVFCDHMATQHMIVHCTGEWSSRPNYLPTRNQPVVISHAQQRIPSHYIARLREEITSQAHRTYFQERYRWDDYIYGQIAWEPLYAIGRRHTSHRSFGNRSKLVHNWLNLGSQRAKFSPHQLPNTTQQSCPYCCAEETFLHLLTCADPRAKKCRFDASTKLRKGLCSFQGGSTLLRIINLWIQHPTQPLQVVAPTRDLQQPVNQAIASQTSIGWEHLFRGIISRSWGSITSPTDTTPASTMKVNAHHNLTCAIHALQEYSLAIWTGRNDMLHSNTTIPITIREAQVNSEITALYNLHHTFTSRVQHYFRQPLRTLLSAPYRTRQRWLIITKLATAQQLQLTNGQTRLTSYNFSRHHDISLVDHITPLRPHHTQRPTTQIQLTAFFPPSIK
jgi:hypothetical protein